jgi:hypothetical protein
MTVVKFPRTPRLKKNPVCCFCGKRCEFYGNNPDPASTVPGASCCDDCNDFWVLPERIYGPDVPRHVREGYARYMRNWKQKMLSKLQEEQT